MIYSRLAIQDILYATIRHMQDNRQCLLSLGCTNFKSMWGIPDICGTIERPFQPFRSMQVDCEGKFQMVLILLSMGIRTMLAL